MAIHQEVARHLLDFAIAAIVTEPSKLREPPLPADTMSSSPGAGSTSVVAAPDD